MLAILTDWHYLYSLMSSFSKYDDSDGCDGFFESGGGVQNIVTVVTAVTGSGVKCQGGIPVGGDCRKAIQPEPLDIWPTEDTCRVVEKFRRGAGRPFQRAALLGEATAVAGGKAPTPPRRAQMRF